MKLMVRCPNCNGHVFTGYELDNIGSLNMTNETCRCQCCGKKFQYGSQDIISGEEGRTRKP